MKKRWILCAAALVIMVLVGGYISTEGRGSSSDKGVKEKRDTTEIQDVAENREDEVKITVFAAKSLNNVMEDLIRNYEETHPKVSIVGSYDSSGTLMEQIREGAPCDVFFSAAQKQMNQLEEEGFLVEGTRRDVVNNQVCLVTYKDSMTEVKDLGDLKKASSMALADGSVPVGRYTRVALIHAGLLEKTGEPAEITTRQISQALGNLEINECANVGAVAAAVAEGANEVGTVYYSDTFGYEDKLEILEKIPYDLSGDIIYPAAQVRNGQADEAQQKAAEEFTAYLVSDAAKEIFKDYYFDTEIGE
ncbi:MAG: molybdate ABC transporter substrate-binding protein [Lachnospiraceae bacterium]|jgi:molybdate transport system substrate-binding protein|nr:molybdate ABC transporter substrate-binding protein [Lachnospiraceae bacterium]